MCPHMSFRFATRAELLGLFHGANGPRAAAIDDRHQRVVARGGIGFVALRHAPRGGMHFVPFSCPEEPDRQGDKVWQAEAQIAPAGNEAWHWCCVSVGRKPDEVVVSENEQLIRELESGQSQWRAGFDAGPRTVQLSQVVFRRRGFHQSNSVGYCQVYDIEP